MGKKVVSELVGGRKMNKSKEYEYEVKYAGSTVDSGEYLGAKSLKKMGWEKAMKGVDLKLAQLAGMFIKPLSTKNVEQHLNGCGLAPEFGTHYRMSALSGGQKVKVVIAAAMWALPHIVILDEPTNYLDRDSLGALAGAIRTYEGGVVITHNNEFCSALCPETWLMQKDAADGIAVCNCKGDAEWMAKASKASVQAAVQLDEITDALGNVVKIEKEKKSKDKMSRKEKKQAEKIRKAKIANGEAVSLDDDWD